MIAEKTVKVKDGVINLPRLDGFSGERSWRPTPDGGEYSNIEFAQEEHIDKYLLALAKPLATITRFCRDGKEAMHLVFNARDGKKDSSRDRLKAARRIVQKFARDQIRLKYCCDRLGVYIDYEGPTAKGEALGCWLWQDFTFTGVFAETSGGKLYLGTGDGYHRQGSYDLLKDGDEQPPDDFDPEDEDAAMYDPVWYRAYSLDHPMDCMAGIAKACKLMIAHGKGFAACDEKYEYAYRELRPKLKKVQNRHPRIQESINRHRVTLAV